MLTCVYVIHILRKRPDNSNNAILNISYGITYLNVISNIICIVIIHKTILDEIIISKRNYMNSKKIIIAKN